MFKKLIQSSIAFAAITAVSSMSTLLLVNSAYAGQLTVNVKDISSAQGYLMVALFSGEQSYKSGKPAKATRVKVSGEQEVVTFSEIADGDYAIKMYHDENDNKELDKNFLGIPSEGYGFSNNKGQFGQPSYQEASFSVNQDTKIDINLF